MHPGCFLLMTTRTVRFLSVLILVSTSLAFSAQNGASQEVTATGKIAGTVRDSSGNPLVEAGIEAVEEGTINTPAGGGIFTLSYANGKYVLEVPPGVYRLRVSFPKYETTTISRVTVAAGETTPLNIVLSEVLVEIDEMKVVARAKRETETVQLLRRKTATNIMDNMSAEIIAKTPDSDVAGLLTRMPGVTISEGKYLQARGLPKRYNRTLFNNAVLPTTRPNEKVVPLDLFPATVVESINVIKSYTPSLPANFAGGLAMIETRSIPDERVFSLSSNVEYNSKTTFKDYQTYRGGSYDWAGYDDGTRDLPRAIPSDRVVREGVIGRGGYSPLEMERFGEAFENNWKTYEKEAPPNQDYTLVYGDRFNKVGGILVGRYKHKFENRYDEEQRIYSAGGGKLSLDNAYKFKTSFEKAMLTGLLNTGIDLTADHRISFNNFYHNTGTDEVRFYEGFNSDLGAPINDTRLRWQEEELFSSQLKGDHRIDDLSESEIDWSYTYSHARLQEPDLREYQYEYNRFVEKFLLADESMSGFRMWTDQKEDVHDFSFDWKVTFYQWAGLASALQAGTAYLHRSRDFGSRRFQYMPRDTTGIDLSRPIEDILKPWNINEYNYELNETTRPTDTYDSEQDVKAGYLSLDLPIISRFRLSGGFRYEWSHIMVDTFNLFDPGERITTDLKAEDIFPALNLTCSLTGDMSIRAGYSETTSRPEFHELAPFEFTDVRGGRTIKGNPNLKAAYIDNYDLRWEWFFGQGELISISGFYKEFKNAIERSIQPTIELRTTFVNADDAWLYGVEWELRKNLGFIAPPLKNFYLIGNYIYTQSESETKPRAGFVPTNDKRAMEGQADHVYNITLEYDNPAWGFTGRILYNFTNERISDIGALGLPDIILEESSVFDIVLIKKFKENLTFKLVAENITNEGVKYTQGGKLFEKYKLGVTFKAGVTYTF